MSTGRSFWVVVVLLAASLVLANLPTVQDPVYHALYFHLSYLWALLLIFGYIWSLLALRWVLVVRQSYNLRQQVGQIFEERFVVRNLAGMPRLWIELRDGTALPGAAGSRLLTWIGSRQSRSYMAYTWLSQRGQFRLGPTDLVSGDVFGLFQVRKRIETRTSLLVIPYMVNLPFFPSPHGLLSGGKALRQRSLEVSPYAASVREYAPGDPLNRIHWPTTARRERLMVKEFEQDPQSNVWIFLDAQRFVQASLPYEKPQVQNETYWLWKRPTEVMLPPSTIEYAVSAGASIANYFIHQGQAVGMVCAGQVFITLPAERGERQLGKILETLAFIQPEGDLPLQGLVGAQVRNLSRGSTVVLVTSSTQPGVVQASNELLLRGMRPVVVLIDAASFGGLHGSQHLQADLASLSVPVFRIAYRDNLVTALAGDRSGFASVNSWWKETAY